MTRLLSLLAIAGVVLGLMVSPAFTQEATAEDHIKYHRFLEGDWKVTAQEGDQKRSGTCRYHLAPNGKCYILHHKLDGGLEQQDLQGYDPVLKKWVMPGFDADGAYVATLEIAGMKPGKTMNEGVVGTWESTHHRANGKIITRKERLVCVKVSREELVFRWEDRKEDGKTLPDVTLTLKRVK